MAKKKLIDPDIQVKIHKRCKTTPQNKISIAVGQTIGWETNAGTFYLILPGGVFEGKDIPFVQEVNSNPGFHPPGGLKAAFDATIPNYVHDVKGVNCVEKVIVPDPPEIIIGSGLRKKKRKKKV